MPSVKPISLSAAEGATLTAVASTGAAYLTLPPHPVAWYVAVFAVAFAGYLGYKAYKSPPAA